MNENKKFSFQSHPTFRECKIVKLPDWHQGKHDCFPIYFPILYEISLELYKTTTACFKLSFQKSLVSLQLDALHFVWKVPQNFEKFVLST